MARIILLKDVPKVGQRGDVKEVKDGFFRNFLLPRKLAEIASRDVLRKREKELALKSEEKQKFAKESSSEFAKIADIKLIFNAKVNKKGSLYKAISEEDIIEKLAEAGSRHIKAEWIKINKPLKTAGEHEVQIESPQGDKGILKIEIKALEE